MFFYSRKYSAGMQEVSAAYAEGMHVVDVAAPDWVTLDVSPKLTKVTFPVAPRRLFLPIVRQVDVLEEGIDLAGQRLLPPPLAGWKRIRDGRMAKSAGFPRTASARSHSGKITEKIADIRGYKSARSRVIEIARWFALLFALKSHFRFLAAACACALRGSAGINECKIRMEKINEWMTFI